MAYAAGGSDVVVDSLLMGAPIVFWGALCLIIITLFITLYPSSVAVTSIATRNYS